jgi:hypothetical protein
MSHAKYCMCLSKNLASRKIINFYGLFPTKCQKLTQTSTLCTRSQSTCLITLTNKFLRRITKIIHHPEFLRHQSLLPVFCHLFPISQTCHCKRMPPSGNQTPEIKLWKSHATRNHPLLLQCLM